MAYKLLLDRELGDDWITWLPEALYKAIYDQWGVFPSTDVSNKLNAIKTFYTTDLFYHDAPAFEHMVLAINDHAFDANTLQLSLPEEIAYAIAVLKADPSKFEREVKGYVRVCCQNVGLLVYPNALKFAQPEYEGELARMAAKIRPTSQEPESDTDTIAVQGYKLGLVIRAIGEKLSEMSIEMLQPSIE